MTDKSPPKEVPSARPELSAQVMTTIAKMKANLDRSPEEPAEKHEKFDECWDARRKRYEAIAKSLKGEP